MARLPPDRLQRIVVFNFGDAGFDDYLEHEPWLEWTNWEPGWTLFDECGRPVPHQLVLAEACRENTVRLLFRAKVPAGGMRVFRIGEGKPPRARAEKFRCALRDGAVAEPGQWCLKCYIMFPTQVRCRLRVVLYLLII